VTPAFFLSPLSFLLERVDVPTLLPPGNRCSISPFWCFDHVENLFDVCLVIAPFGPFPLYSCPRHPGPLLLQRTNSYLKFSPSLTLKFFSAIPTFFFETPSAALPFSPQTGFFPFCFDRFFYFSSCSPLCMASLPSITCCISPPPYWFRGKFFVGLIFCTDLPVHSPSLSSCIPPSAFFFLPFAPLPFLCTGGNPLHSSSVSWLLNAFSFSHPRSLSPGRALTISRWCWSCFPGTLTVLCFFFALFPLNPSPHFFFPFLLFHLHGLGLLRPLYVHPRPTLFIIAFPVFSPRRFLFCPFFGFWPPASP